MIMKTCLTEVMKNIYTFANILSAANTELVTCWEPSSVTNALKWTNYCMKIEKETRNSFFRGDLDRQIQLMTIMLNPVSLLLLSIDTLSEAQYLLSKSLIQNPCTPAAVLTRLIDTTGCSIEQDITQKQREKMQSGHRIYQLLGEDISFVEKCDKSQALHIMSRLVRLQKICCSNQHRYNMFLEKILNELQKHRNGWNVIVYMLLLDVVCEADHDVITCIKTKMMDAVTFMTRDVDCGLWRCTCSLLLEASALDDSFAVLYAEYLQSWAEDMVPVYVVQDSGDMYCWRHKDSHISNGYSYTELQKHVVGILMNNGVLQRKIKTTLSEKSRLSYFNIYKDLLQSCNSFINRDSQQMHFTLPKCVVKF